MPLASRNGHHINLLKCVKISYEMFDFDLMIVSFSGFPALWFAAFLWLIRSARGQVEIRFVILHYNVRAHLSKQSRQKSIMLLRNFIIIAVLFVLLLLYSRFY